MSRQLVSLALFGSLALSCLNSVAAVVGLPAAMERVFGSAPSFLLGLLALGLIGLLALSWLNSFMSNRAGMALYAVNLVLAPFGYVQMGLPLWLGVALALSPVPFYRGLCWLSGRVKRG